MNHPARKIPVLELLTHLDKEKQNRNVIEINQGNLALYFYTNHCVYKENWNSINTMARGLIIDRQSYQIIATPFPKFFNYGERQIILPDESFEVFEKIDGSLIIAFNYQEEWKTATKGAFNSIQAQKAKILLDKLPTHYLEKDTTYLFEYIAPDNLIVVRYPEEKLVLLAAYSETGDELSYVELKDIAHKLDIPITQRFAYESLLNLLETAKVLDKNNEGFVIRYHSGLRLKIKGSEYGKIQKLITGVTPLALWELMKDKANLSLIRQDIPEEYWHDFDQIVATINEKLEAIIELVEAYHYQLKAKSDKELGLMINFLPPHVKIFIFTRRKLGEGWYQNHQTQEKLFSLIRPTNNEF